MEQKNNLLYQSEDGALQVDVTLSQETVWLTQAQMALLFDRDKSVISRHIKNVYSENELQKNTTVANFATVQTEGQREVERIIEHYNLDVIISVGYRVKSKQGTRFRQWANKILKNYMLQGFALNQERLKAQARRLEELRQTVEYLSVKIEEGYQAQDLLFIIRRYVRALDLINQFDEGRLEPPQKKRSVVYTLSYSDCVKVIEKLKENLMQRNEASEMFGRPKDEGLHSVVGAVNQTVFGEDAYPSVEEKAANLLYMTIKNHPFVDGNKRIGVFLFVWFLERNNANQNADGLKNFDENALTSLAYLVAGSDPADREMIMNLIMAMIRA